ncbi:hypothetical protein BGZ63DRAFT_453186 [Mariannaea sp. PMI_226]|nr:hypothetical protein BGZ63DRAFT_453186 [Mariannaea sp. PMI_226]
MATQNSAAAPTDIAIVGMACRFAGDAKSPEAFYDMLQKGKDAWSKIPASRFNAEAFRHPSKDRSGTTVCEGGYFLEEDVTRWDAPFFSCSAAEAASYDPQQRLLLEIAYESLESAGIPITKIAGTDAACFIGGFSEDYKTVVSRDLHAAPRYAKTGTALSILANRISWFFNLRGASVTCDTACSSSMAALHLACEAIRSNTTPTRCALVGGATLILDPDDHCGLNALGFLSPQSRCFSFDVRADGYARGEGVGVIVLKHIEDAIRDGDPIRAVIRGTGLNSDGRTAGITLPSSMAQQSLIANTYRMAGLTLDKTQYVELHGTGTKAGDSAELRAIHNTISSIKSEPVYCGSVKSRIGHTEAAAGIASIIKSVLCLEKGVITPNLNFSTINPRFELESSNIVVPTSAIPWPKCDVRRCSINNFGFGGTNAHAILDNASDYLQSRGILQQQNNEPSRAQPYIFVLSAPEQAAVSRQCLAHASYIASTATTLPRLARTLSDRRSLFQWRHAVVAESASELSSVWKDGEIRPIKALRNPNVALVFTGQGAQWFAMGRELFKYPHFADSIRQSTVYLAELGCTWDAWRELVEPKSDHESNIKSSEYSQPLCLILQMALVDLVTHWGIKPAAVIGHSSGEIAAAYAANALSRQDCIKIAYHRGLVSILAQARQPGGCMMAVGLSANQVAAYVIPTNGAVIVACNNSPESVTLAGDRAELEKLKKQLEDDKKFCRLLYVENAYHSPQMQSVAVHYFDSIKDISPLPNTSSVAFYSTVYGSLTDTSKLAAEYWVKNLCSPVKFLEALDDMMSPSIPSQRAHLQRKIPNILLEIGPHSALAGPIKQFRAHRPTLQAVSYQSLLVRGQDASHTAMGAAGALWAVGVPIQLGLVNGVDSLISVLTDLPSYQWDHATSYWHESRQSRNHRRPQFSRNDLIGSWIDCYNPIEPMWKNYLRVRELPWLQDHKIHGDIVFPAAGMVCSAIEAVRQMATAEGTIENVSGYELRDFSITKALVIPDNESGTEVYIHLKPRKLGIGAGAGVGAGSWLEFSYYSCKDGTNFTEHATGLLKVHCVKEVTEVDAGKEAKEEANAYHKRWQSGRVLCTENIPRSSHYSFQDSLGFQFGETFRGLHHARKDGLTIAFEIRIADTRAVMPEFKESGYVMHPATLDSIFQSMILTIPNLEHVEKQLWVPTGASYIFLSAKADRGYGSKMRGLAEPSMTGVREIKGSVLVKGSEDQDSLPVVVIDDLTFTGLGSEPKPLQRSEILASRLYSTPTWMPDADLLDARILRAVSGAATGPDAISTLPGLSDPPDIESFVAEYPVDGQVVLHVFRSLGAIFSQRLTPIAVLRQDNMLTKAYHEVYGFHVSTDVMKTWFRLKAHKQPSIRVIEIGAGTASSTLPILRELSQRGGNASTPQFASWTFTDISAAWFENAKTVLSNWEGLVEYKELDINKDPAQQGFQVNSYDIVLAVNVLHATKDIQQTLRHCYKLLKPGGNIVLGELTNPEDIGCFVFGIMPGWWAAEDDRKGKPSPLLSQSQWHESLLKAGFSGADICLADNDDPSAHRISTIIGQRLLDTPRKGISVIVPNQCGTVTRMVASDVCQRLTSLGNAVSISELQTVLGNADDKSIIALLDYEDAFFENISQRDFECAQQLLVHNREVLWVTRSDPEDSPGHPAKRIISGLLRCMKTEDSSRQLYELHLSRPIDSDIRSTSTTICRRLQTIWSSVQDETLVGEMETEERDGMLQIQRHIPYPELNTSLSHSTRPAAIQPKPGNLLQPGRPLKLVIGQPGMLDTLHFVDDAVSQPLGDNDIEIEVTACALNFRDIMIALGQIKRPLLGHEAAGVVSRVGSKARFSCGDRVLFTGPGAIRTHIRAHESVVQKLPDSMSFEQGVSIPIVYVTAYRSLVEVARLERGESVLIHAAAGGLGQALIQIATMLEAEIYCTVGTNTKRQAVIGLGVKPDRILSSRDLTFSKGIQRLTGGRGVDVVVNCLAGEALRQGWACLAPYGRFVEVGVTDILNNSGLDMRPFLYNRVFAAVNVAAMIDQEPLRFQTILTKVLDLIERRIIDFIHPLTIYDFSRLEDSFREMQRGNHTGKLVLQITSESRVPVLPRTEIPLCLRSDGTYILVGGLGGLGRAQAIFMAENGARHLAFISRSGNTRPEAKTVIASLQKSGVQVKVYTGDVANGDQLRTVLADISTSMPPIRGVIQGAMVLADSLFHRMSYEQWLTATRPKIQGTWNLHQLLPADLDFFITMSSLSGICGSVSQSNYAAGNTFQDALMHWRRHKNLAAQSLDIGVVRGIGYVEEHEDARARTSQLRLTEVGVNEVMHAFRSALAGTPDGENKLATQIIMGAGSGGIQQLLKETDDSVDFYWLRQLASFSYLRQMHTEVKGDSEKEGQDETSKLLAQLRICQSLDEATEVSQNLLLSGIAKHLSIPAYDIATERPIHMYGIDSLVAVELRNWLSLKLKSELTIFDLTGSDPITEVSKKVASRSKLVPMAIKSVA